MSYQSIIEYFQVLAKIYFKATKREKKSLLDHAEAVTKYKRKSIIRSLKKAKIEQNNKKRCGAKKKYPEDLLIPHIEYLWNTMERLSARRLKAGFRRWLRDYHENGVTAHIKLLLNKMSVSTLGRFLAKIREYESKIKNKRLTSTVPARYMQNKVPINTGIFQDS